MNVLLITFSFPPAGGVGVLRALSLAKYLPESNVRVDVLTARNAPSVGRDESLLRQVPAAVTVHRTWTLDLPFALRKGVKKLLTRKSSTPAPRQSAPARPGLLSRIKTSVANLLLPDPQIGWLPFAYPAARRIIRKRKIDAVLITVPPFSSVKLATKLRKRFPQLPIVVDFRDEWLTSTLHLVSFNANAKARRVAEQTERDAVHAATRVVMVTEAAVEELRKRYPNEPRDKFLAIPNGYETPAQPYTPAPAHADEPITLTYMGTVYGSTDPLTTVAAIHQLAPEIRRRLRLRFIGHVETDTFRDALASVPDVVELAGFMPQARALEALRASHYALLITHDPINVSAKFYDYLGTGIPIVAAVHPAGDVRRLLERTRAGWWAASSDPEAIAKLLTEAVERASSGAVEFSPDRDAVAQFHRRPLAARYAALLHELAARPQP